MAPHSSTCVYRQTRGENKGAKTLKRETNNGGNDDHFPGHLHSTAPLRNGQSRAQGANQITDLLRHHRPSRLSPSNLPRPEQAKPFAVPAHHGRWLDEEEAGPPVVPDAV